MSYTNLLCALIVMGFFLSGLSQAFLPAYTAWAAATAEYQSARTIYFIAESFRRECEKTNRNIENWEKQVASAKELESHEITELWQGEILRALKLVCIVSGERVEIIGLCTP